MSLYSVYHSYFSKTLLKTKQIQYMYVKGTVSIRILQQIVDVTQYVIGDTMTVCHKILFEMGPEYYMSV